MDRDLPIVAPGALRFLRAIATALPRGHIHMRSIYERRRAWIFKEGRVIAVAYGGSHALLLKLLARQL